MAALAAWLIVAGGERRSHPGRRRGVLLGRRNIEVRSNLGHPPMYHGESRKLQDQFDTRRLADRLVDRLLRTTFNDDDRSFIESQRMFFLATMDAEGFPDCSYKGGDPGFVRVIDERTLVFPSYDGNGMFKSLGNIRANPAVGLLFLASRSHDAFASMAPQA